MTTTDHEQTRDEDPQDRRCEAELHLRVCAVTLPTGHLQYRWRIERLDRAAQDGDSARGTFGPFQLPHECGQEVAAAIRHWMRSTSTDIIGRNATNDNHPEGTQLTMSEYVSDW